VNYTSIAENLPTRQFGATATHKWRGRARRCVSPSSKLLLDAATSYMNLLRDQSILDLNRRNVEVLTEQLKQTRDRFNVGEVTRTDVAQAESRSSDRNTRESTALLTMPRFSLTGAILT